MDEVIENAQVEEAPKPKQKRTRKKKVEPVEVEQVQPEPEPVDVEEMPAKAPETISKADAAPKPKGYRARVTVGLLNVRERPTKASKTICDPLTANAVVDIVENAGAWGKLAGEGYVMLEYVERID